jgi:MFS family permease
LEAIMANPAATGPAPGPVAQSSTSPARRRAVVASTVGTTIEWYDFFLYNTAASLIFPALFFPKQAAFTGILLSFGTQFVGFAARPVGAAIFGHFGDRIGRKAMLITTLLLMGISTFLIGLLPSYHTIGYAGPILLTLLRIGQGLGVGGEWGGSVLLSMEWGVRRRRGLMASWPQLGVPLGLVLSTGVVRLMTSWTGDSFDSWGWRIPFLLSAVLVGVGLYVRLRVLESPEFTAVRDRAIVLAQPLIEVVRRQWHTILSSAFVRMSEQAPFYLFTSFVLTYGTTHLGMVRDDLLNVRYSGAGLGYQLASVIAGGPAPLIATRILEKTGSSTGIAWYIVGCCVLSAVALLLLPARTIAPEQVPESKPEPTAAV